MAARTPKTDPTLAISYLRVSTQAQADSGLGLDAQRKDIERYAAANGITLVGEFIDAGISGTKGPEGRPGLQAAIAEGKGSRVGYLICSKLCRLSRDELDSLTIERQLNRIGIQVKSAAGEGTEAAGINGQLMAGMFRLFAAHEARVIGERTKKALAEKKIRSAKDGTWAGGRPPYGFTVDSDGFLFPTDGFDELMKAMALRLDGVSIRKAAKQLGVTHTKVQRWTNYWMDQPEELLSYVPAYEATV